MSGSKGPTDGRCEHLRVRRHIRVLDNGKGMPKDIGELTDGTTDATGGFRPRPGASDGGPAIDEWRSLHIPAPKAQLILLRDVLARAQRQPFPAR